MVDNYHYQLVRSYGKYDFEYVVHEARVNDYGELEIAAIPFTLVGNHPDEIRDTLKQITADIATYKPVDKEECVIYYDELWHGDELFEENM